MGPPPRGVLDAVLQLLSSLVALPDKSGLLALGADARTRTAAQDLARRAAWSGLGRADQTLWGECVSTRREDPPRTYRVRVWMEGPRSTCSCPSRARPCKHALALMLLAVEDAAALPHLEEPPDVTRWVRLTERRAATRLAPPSAAQARHRDRRLDQREARMRAGLEDLRRFTVDLLEEGLARREPTLRAGLSTLARRLVDAQAPGAASRVRALAQRVGQGQEWPEHVLGGLARLHRLTEAFGRADELPDPLRAELRALLGINVQERSLRARPATRDAWVVLAARMDEVEDQRLLFRRSWVLGLQSGALWVLVDFARELDAFDADVAPGVVLDAELVPHPAAVRQRATRVATHGRRSLSPEELSPHAIGVDALLDRHATRLAASPFVERTPALLGGVVPARVGDAWFVCDGSGAALRIDADAHGLLAETGAHPCTYFGEWDGDEFQLHAVFPGNIAAPAPCALDPVGAPRWPRSLVEGAVLGASRGTLETGLESVDRRAPASPSAPPAERLLVLAALTQSYLGAGRRARGGIEPMLPAPDAADRPAPERATPLIREILDGGLSALLPELARTLEATGRCLPRAVLPRALAVEGRSTRRTLAPLLGARGRWLAREVGAEWAIPRSLEEQVAMLDEATPVDQLELLSSIGAQDRTLQRRIIDDRLPDEHAGQRAQLLDLLAKDLRPEDLPLLEALADDRSPTVRARAGALRARLPGSPTARRDQARAGRAIPGLERARLSLSALWSERPPPRLIVSLPGDDEDEHQAWDADGYLLSAPPGVSTGTHLLRQLLARTPPDAWTARLGLTPAAFVRALAEVESSEALLAGLSTAVLEFGADAWVPSLIDALGELPATVVGPLYARLDDAELGRRAPELFRRGEPLEALAYVPAPFGPALSAAFWALGLAWPIERVGAVQGWRVFLQKAAWALPLDTLRVPDDRPSVDPRSPAAPWVRELVEDFLSMLRARLALRDALR